MLHLSLVTAVAVLSFTSPAAVPSSATVPAPAAVTDPDPQASSNLVGTHEVLGEDGDAVVPGAVATMVVTQTGWGTYDGKVFLDRGNGPVEVPSESIKIVGFFGEYLWWNEVDPAPGEDRGTGRISEVGAFGGNHKSEVTGGVHEGKKRDLVRQ